MPDYPFYPERPELCPKCGAVGDVYVDIFAGQVTVLCAAKHHVVRHGATKGAGWVDRVQDEWEARRAVVK